MPEPVTPRLSRPVRLAVRFLAPAAWREPLLGDLEEMLADEIESGAGVSAARRRIFFEALRSCLASRRPSPTPSRPGARRPSGDPVMTAFLFDVRAAWRSLRRSPVFALVVVATLALGIGCVTAFWSLFDAVLLRPLPFDEPERLVHLWGENIESPGGRFNMSYPDFADVEEAASAFSHLAVYHTTFSNLLRQGDTPERLPALFISHDFFDTLGLDTALGLDFAPRDDKPGATATVILSTSLWRRAFGGDPDVLGRTVRVDDVVRTVIGVAPEGFDFPRAADVFLPVHGLSGIEHRGVHTLKVIGRLSQDADLALAAEQLDQVAARLREAYPESNATAGLRVESLHESVVSPVRPRLALVSVAAAFLLLVVCANVSSLLLERATRRRREVATRSALGASRGQLLRHFLAEAALLTGLGVLGAIGVAHLVRRLLLDFGPELPRHVAPGLDARTLAFAAAVTAGVGALFAIIPGLHALGHDLYRRLGVGLVGSGGRGGQRWRAAFVVVQVALAVVLTLGAALLVQSLDRLYAVDLGFDPEGVLAVDMEVSTPFISDAWPETVAFYEELIERLEGVPGVVSAAAAHQHPANPGWSTSFTVKGEPEPPPGRKPEANFRPVTADYFETASIPLLRGRVFDDSVRSEPPGQVVVNQAFVDAYLGGGQAVARRLVRDCWWNREITEYEILGVVADTRFGGRHRPPRPAMYFPHRQDAPPMMTVLVRAESGLDPLSLLPALREIVLDIDPEMAVGSAATLEELVRDTVKIRRFLTWLLTAFAAVTLALAALGLYGALAFATARRTRELGLRMALGARAAHLHRMILMDGLRLAGLGVALGLAGAWLSSRTLEALLFDIDRGDPATFAGTAALLALVALGAGSLPAWRATRIDPCRALAEE